MKLKKILMESNVWDRKFGEKLPTLADVQKKFEQKKLNEATRWSVGIEEPNGKVTSVYGHYDGYPEYVGKLLKKHFSNPSLVKQLIKLGKAGISTLGKKIGKKHDFDMPYDEKEKLGYTTFYGRDRGEGGNFTQVSKDRTQIKTNSGEEWLYIWSVKDKKWYYRAEESPRDSWKEL